MAPADSNPLAAIAALAGGAMSGGSFSDLEGTADQLYRLSLATGYKSLATFAQACREMHAEIANEIRSPSDG